MGQQCYVPLSLFHCPARRITISCRVAQQTINKHLQAPLHRVLQWTGLEQVYLLRCTKRTGEFTLQRPTDLWGVVESRKFLGVSSPLCRRTRQVGGQSKTQLVSYIKDVYSKIRSKTTCFGLIWPSSGFFSFSLKVSLYKLRFMQRNLKGKRKTPDDGHIRPKHVVLLLILEYTSFI